jgi:hypothetical protein
MTDRKLAGRDKILDQATRPTTRVGDYLETGPSARRRSRAGTEQLLIRQQWINADVWERRYEDRAQQQARLEASRTRTLRERPGSITTDVLRQWCASPGGSLVAAAELARRHPAEASRANLTDPAVTS